MATSQKDLRELLHEVAETHHVVWKITDGDDPDWASWYADHLLRLTHFLLRRTQPAVLVRLAADRVRGERLLEHGGQPRGW